jgi:hypothetical protein
LARLCRTGASFRVWAAITGLVAREALIKRAVFVMIPPV